MNYIGHRRPGENDGLLGLIDLDAEAVELLLAFVGWAHAHQHLLSLGFSIVCESYLYLTRIFHGNTKDQKCSIHTQYFFKLNLTMIVL